MACCPHCQEADSLFNQRDARQRLRRYQRRGPEGTTKVLLAALRAAGVSGASVLDIGGGVGVLHHELLRSGAVSAVDVDASSAYLAAAREESTRQGHLEHVRYLYGDFVALAPELAPASIVTLDRVVCCYPAMPALVGAAAARAERLLGLVYPRDVWWVRAGVRAVNLAFAAQRSAFRLFCHPTAAVDAIVRQAGLTQCFAAYRGPWQIVLYTRDGSARITKAKSQDGQTARRYCSTFVLKMGHRKTHMLPMQDSIEGQRAQTRAVLLDLDDTLFDHSHSSSAGVQAVCAANAVLGARPFTTVLADHATILEELHLLVLRGVMTIDDARVERFRRLLALHSADGDAVAAATCYRAAYQAQRQPVAGARALLEYLRGRAAVAIVTNNAQVEQEEKLHTLGLAHLVDALVTSQAVGVAKPDPAIFALALAQLGCRAENAVMLGDSWAADVCGAQAAGVRAIWLNRHGRAYPGAEVRLQDSGLRSASVTLGASAKQAVFAHEIHSLEPTAELAALLLGAGVG
ncbi:HAD-IA family hydrolase [Candidatus Gracilibacteria bacterium]|nr:HAD-IA family hydrolase [Candidatus Gracilibacteria bacterium]